MRDPLRLARWRAQSTSPTCVGKAIDDAPDILPDAPPEFADLVSEPFDAAEYAWRPNAVGQQEWAVLQG